MLPPPDDPSTLQNIFNNLPLNEINTDLTTLNQISPDLASLNQINNNYLTDPVPPKLELLQSKPKFAEIQSSDLSAEFEMVNGLKNYATVNTAEPIPTQLSYNIGTENVENGRDETLNNTEMQLEESSVITEIENQGLDLYDLGRSNVSNFDIELFGVQNDALMSDLYVPKTPPPPSKSPNVKIISVQNIPPAQKPSITETSESFDSSNWENVMMNAFNQITDETSLNTPYNTYFNQPATNDNFTANFPQPNAKSENILKDLTADADICKCIDCKCTPFDNCHGCNVSEAPETSGGCCKPQEASVSTCCGKKNGANRSCAPHKTHSEKNEDEQCCVVVCLKTIKQLKDMLQLASCINAQKTAATFSNFDDLTVSCVKSLDVCNYKK